MSIVAAGRRQDQFAEQRGREAPPAGVRVSLRNDAVM